MARNHRDGLLAPVGAESLWLVWRVLAAAGFAAGHFSGRSDYLHDHHMVCLEVTKWVI